MAVRYTEEQLNTVDKSLLIQMFLNQQEQLQTLTAEVASLNEKMQLMMEQMILANRNRFGRSSEKMTDASQISFMEVDGTIVFFNEAEAVCDLDTPEPEHLKKSAPRPVKKKGKKEQDLSGLPTHRIDHYMTEEELTAEFGKNGWKQLPDAISRRYRFVPAKVEVEEHHIGVYADKKDGHMVKAEHPRGLLHGSAVSPTLAAAIINGKYVNAIPLYRLEQEFQRQGLKLSRQTMANWILQASDTWLRPVYDALHRKLCRETVLHGDETTLQVLKEPGRTSTSKSYMWVYRTSGCAEYPIVLYEYQPSRKAEHAQAFLEGFSGWLHADGYQGYHKLPENIRVVGCWAHARRKFDEALQTLPKEKRQESLAATGECYCTRLFQLEQALVDLTPEERYTKRLELEKPVLDALLAWANETSAKTAPKSALGKALQYLREQWPYLVRYLEDGRLELSNNRAERSIKPFVIGRKNWLFSNTPAGAQSSAVIYSLIETAKENDLDPYRYLVWLLNHAPGLSRTDEVWAESFLPVNAPQECKIPKP